MASNFGDRFRRPRLKTFRISQNILLSVDLYFLSYHVKSISNLFFSRLSLDRGGRTTKDYEGPTVAPRVQAALDAAMANIEPDIELDVRALQSNPVVKGTRKPKKNSLNGSNPNSGGGGNGSGASGSGNNNSKAYPSSRGLVPK